MSAFISSISHISSSVDQLTACLDDLRNQSKIVDLQNACLQHIVRLIPADACTFYYFHPQKAEEPEHIATLGTEEAFLSRYESQGRRQDPLYAHIKDTRAVHSSDRLLGLRGWHRHPLFSILKPYRMDHVLQAPLFQDGTIVGTLNFCRARPQKAFGDKDIAVAETLRRFLELCIANVMLQASRPPAGEAGRDKAAPDAKADPVKLTRREKEIVRLVAQGIKNAEIANAAFISVNTVKRHLEHIFDKYGVCTRAALVAKALAETQAGSAE